MNQKKGNVLGIKRGLKIGKTLVPVLKDALPFGDKPQPMHQTRYVPLLIHPYDLQASLAGLSPCAGLPHLLKGVRQLFL